MKRIRTLLFLFFAVIGDLAVAEEDERIKSCRLSLRSSISIEWLPKNVSLDSNLKNSARAPLSTYLFVQYIRDYFGESKLTKDYVVNVIKRESFLNHSLSLFRLGELIEAELIDAGLHEIAKISYQGLRHRPELEAQYHDSKMIFEKFSLRSEFSINALKNSHPHIINFDRFKADGSFDTTSYFLIHWDKKTKEFSAIDPINPEAQFKVEIIDSKKSKLPRLIIKNSPVHFKITNMEKLDPKADSALYVPLASIGLL
ncbi:MAG: hypothetical protein VX642_06315 [Bdellovibrionota bacterium]|nr:hypothetical protein [Bdellovibrionota bacterium]